MQSFKLLGITFILVVCLARCSNSVAFIGSAIVAKQPCINSTYVSESFESDQPPEDENKFELSLFVDDIYSNGVPRYSTLQLRFDSTTNITLISDYGRVRADGDGKFYINIFRDIKDISMTVRGLQGRPVPNLLSVILNNDELCPYGTKIGLWDSYIRGSSVSGLTTVENRNISPGCGQKKIYHNALITNAQSTKPGDWPWHIAIYKTERNSASQSYICGGSLLKTSRVLTAGHCVVESGVKVIPQRLFVIAGKYNLVGPDISRVETGVHEIILHEQFTATTLNNDIAILVLESEITFGDYIQPICLWDKNKNDKSNIVDKNGYVVGWGFNEKDTLSDTLTQGVMPVVSDLACIRSNAPFFDRFLSNTKFCAGFRNGTSVCNGDSGGGMYFSEKDADGRLLWSLRGIVSLSVSRANFLCDPNSYVIFTDAAMFTDWIEKHI